jgi:hypothetical protein
MQKIINNDKKRILSIECSNQRKFTLEKLDDLINKYKHINVNLIFLLKIFFKGFFFRFF